MKAERRGIISGLVSLLTLAGGVVTLESDLTWRCIGLFNCWLSGANFVWMIRNFAEAEAVHDQQSHQEELPR